MISLRKAKVLILNVILLRMYVNYIWEVKKRLLIGLFAQIKVGNYQEMAQSERNSHSKIRGG